MLKVVRDKDLVCREYGASWNQIEGKSEIRFSKQINNG